MFEKITGLLGHTPEPEQEVQLDASSLMIRALNQVPLGTRMQFTIDFGPGLREETVTAYIDPELYTKTGGVSTVMRIEVLSPELHHFIEQ